MRIDLWLTPPAYTGLAPSVFNNIRPDGETIAAKDSPKGEGQVPDAALSGQARPTLIVPVGSQILVHATDVAQPPSIMIGKQAFPLQRLGDGNSASYKLQLDVDAKTVGADRLKVSVGSAAYASWPIIIAADAAPDRICKSAVATQRHTTRSRLYSNRRLRRQIHHHGDPPPERNPGPGW